MAVSGIANQRVVLMVTGVQDSASRHLAEMLSQSGATVYYVSEIYAAVAGLSRGDAISHFIVDTRWLDDYEMQFLKLVPRYYKKTAFLVPTFDDSSAHRGHVGGRFQTLTVPEMIRHLVGDVQESVIEEPLCIAGGIREPVVAAVPARLSTDGGPEAVNEEPAMHDAVRQRMGGLGRGGVVRRPPGADATNLAAPRGEADPLARGRYGTVTPEEIAELLKKDQAKSAEEVELRRREFGGGT